jgi:hypothetical protein
MENLSSTNQSIRENLSVVRNELYDLIIEMNMSEANDVARLQSQLNSINTTLLQIINDLRQLSETNDNELTKQLVELSTKIGLINSTLAEVNSTLSTKISGIPKYNDTPLWNEIGNLSSNISQIQSVVNVNNTTLVNQTVNQTRVLKETADIVVPMVSSGIIGAVTGGAVATVISKRKTKLQQIVLEKGAGMGTIQPQEKNKL